MQIAQRNPRLPKCTGHIHCARMGAIRTIAKGIGWRNGRNECGPYSIPIALCESAGRSYGNTNHRISDQPCAKVLLESWVILPGSLS